MLRNLHDKKQNCFNTMYNYKIAQFFYSSPYPLQKRGTIGWTIL